MSQPSAALHAPESSALQAESQRSLLRMSAGGEVLAVPIEAVREILELGRMTALPRTPEFVRGVMNLRGAVLPVVDLGARLGLPPAEASRKTCVVILELPGDTAPLVVGALVDAVCEVAEFAPTDIQPAPSFGAGIEDRFMQGMIRSDAQFIILLHTSAALSPHELARLAADMATQ